jgi:hypothetical protein
LLGGDLGLRVRLVNFQHLLSKLNDQIGLKEHRRQYVSDFDLCNLDIGLLDWVFQNKAVSAKA